ncbi:MAG TPA: peroxiredoxin [Allosphingosinicella sp.]|nr:peroxiredoxin [Allosphingosinicella sp.]
MVNEGDPVPDVKLEAMDGRAISPADFGGNKLILYFYPKDDTSGCTKEAIGFSEKKPEFDALQTLIVGISPDDERQHDKFKEKYGLTITLAADTEKAAAEAYGVWIEKSMYGRKYMGVDRSTFLVDRNGAIAKVWRNVKVPGHVEEVLEAAKEMGKRG